MIIATIAYLPPKRVEGSQAFHKNITHWRTQHPVHLASDDPSWGLSWRVDDPEKARTRKWFTVSNAVFLSCLSIANALKLDYFIYLESDSRVRGHDWDARMFEEHFSFGRDLACSGTPVLWDPHGAGNQSLRRTTDYAHEYMHRVGMPMCIYGLRQPHQMQGVWLYPNGSVAIYHTETLNSIFHSNGNILQKAFEIPAWDIAIAQGLWAKFGLSVFDRVAGLKCSYSGCTDSYFFLAERREMLMSGEKVAIHQVKSNDSMI